LLLLRASHPPAGATVLIISLGLLTKPIEMTLIMVGVAILTVPDGLSTARSGCRYRLGQAAAKTREPI
jgi:CBS domain-containing membrane protein